MVESLVAETGETDLTSRPVVLPRLGDGVTEAARAEDGRRSPGVWPAPWFDAGHDVALGAQRHGQAVEGMGHRCRPSQGDKVPCVEHPHRRNHE